MTTNVTAPAAGREAGADAAGAAIGAGAAEAVGPTSEDAVHPIIDPVSSSAAAAAVPRPAHGRPLARGAGEGFR